jgi:hypothetical protein
LSLVLTAFAVAIAATITLASVVATAVVVATTAAAAPHQWLVVVLPPPLSATRSVIHCFRHCAIVNTLVAGCCPLSPTFVSRCSVALVPAVHHLRHSRRWLVVGFSPRQAAYQLNHQAENIFMFSHLDLFLFT